MVTKLNEKRLPKSPPRVTNIEPLGAHGLCFCDFVRFWKYVFFDEFFDRQTSRPQIQNISDFGRQIEHLWLVLKGSAGEAVCSSR